LGHNDLEHVAIANVAFGAFHRVQKDRLFDTRGWSEIRGFVAAVKSRRCGLSEGVVQGIKTREGFRKVCFSRSVLAVNEGHQHHFRGVVVDSNKIFYQREEHRWHIVRGWRAIREFL
jgi:hypothetical protein